MYLLMLILLLLGVTQPLIALITLLALRRWSCQFALEIRRYLLLSAGVVSVFFLLEYLQVSLQIFQIYMLIPAYIGVRYFWWYAHHIRRLSRIRAFDRAQKASQTIQRRRRLSPASPELILDASTRLAQCKVYHYKKSSMHI